ncbi:hypothetical protein CMK19_13515 [Candidatus Poribacteria bacterium]|nr:hypothetical protein [Candidatus Poribacteria bacterium]MEE2910192.1 GerMN domain-containing protein [Candidatus Poribacteria bacterium]
MTKPTRFSVTLLFWSVAVFCMFLGLIWWLWPNPDDSSAPIISEWSGAVDIDQPSESNSEMKQISLFRLGDDHRDLVSQTLTIDLPSNLGLALERVLVSLLSLPNDTSPIPFGTYLNQVYVDQYSTAYLDFSNHLNKNHVGGSDAEYLTLKAILETIHVNFPDNIVQVQILINGREIESIAGHFNTSQPLNVQVADNTL